MYIYIYCYLLWENKIGGRCMIKEFKWIFLECIESLLEYKRMIINETILHLSDNFITYSYRYVLHVLNLHKVQMYNLYNIPGKNKW